MYQNAFNQYPIYDCNFSKFLTNLNIILFVQLCTSMTDRSRSNVFGDAKVWFCPNVIKLAQILITFAQKSSKFAQI